MSRWRTTWTARAMAAAAVALCLDGAVSGADELGPRVRQLIKQLDAAELATREDAERALLDLGPQALDLLPAEGERMSAEARQRLGRVRHTLERARAKGFAEETKVTLAGDDLPLDKVWAELARQTGNEIVDFREQFGQAADDGGSLTLKLEARPFWLALDEILDQAELTVYGYSGEPGIALVQRGQTAVDRVGSACYRGAFRIEATQLESHRELRERDRAGMQLTVEVAWEPRLAPLGIRQSLADLKLTDEHGGPIAAAADEGQLEALITPGAMLTELTLPLAPQPRTSGRIASLRGKFEALLPGGVETFTFDGLAKARKVEQRRGGVRVTLDEVRRNNELWEVRMRVAFDETSGALESHRTWVFDNEAYLLGRDKQPLANDGFQTTLQTEDEVGVAYLFDAPDGLDGLSFVYKTPIVVLSVPIEYELRDLPLP